MILIINGSAQYGGWVCLNQPPPCQGCCEVPSCKGGCLLTRWACLPPPLPGIVFVRMWAFRPFSLPHLDLICDDVILFVSDIILSIFAEMNVLWYHPYHAKLDRKEDVTSIVSIRLHS